jgi:hypothetical protein
LKQQLTERYKMRREEKPKSGKESGKSSKTMPEIKGSYSSRYSKADNASRGKVEPIKPTYPSRYK